MTTTKARACDGKIRHSSEGAAKAARLTLISRGLAYEGQMQVYACGHCGGYHVGHRRGRRSR